LRLFQETSVNYHYEEEDGWSRAQRAKAEAEQKARSSEAYHIPYSSIPSIPTIAFKPVDHMLYAIRNGGRLPAEKPWHTKLWCLTKNLKRSGWEGDFERLTQEIRPATWQSLGMTPEQAEIDFNTSWEAVEDAESEFMSAYELSLSDPYQHVSGTEIFKKLVSLCYHLQDSDGSFFISGSAFAKLTGIHQVTASALIKSAVKNGYFVMTEECIFRKKSRVYKWTHRV
jgi:hypothetical protein